MRRTGAKAARRNAQQRSPGLSISSINRNLLAIDALIL
jgi:hypothetical protein